MNGRIRLAEPLGYLDLAALASQARVIVTDSGGLQKEAYWYGVPCVTARPSTEWVDTVEVGANVLVDDDPDRLVAAVARAAMPAERPALYGDGRAAVGSRRPSLGLPDHEHQTRDIAPSDAGDTHFDIAIVGAGYVGVPLAQVFAEAGRSVLLVDVDDDRVGPAQPRRELHRGRPFGASSAGSSTTACARRPTTTSSATPTRS